MVEISEPGRERTDARSQGAAMTASDVQVWFVREVLPLEAMLIQFLHHNWRNRTDVEDMLQDIYVRVCEVALRQIPVPAKPFVFTVARNLLIDRLRREQIIPIEAVADLDALGVAKDEPAPDQHVIAREELRRLQDALDRLPPRCREAIVLRQVDGLSRKEIAARMGIGEGTVKDYVAEGVRALAGMLYRAPANPGRKA